MFCSTVMCGYKRVGLEHHRHAAFGRIEAGDIAGPDRDASIRRFLEPGHHPQQGGLAAARRADEHAEFAIIDGQINAVNDLNVTVTLDHIVEGDAAHFLILSVLSYPADIVRDRIVSISRRS